MHTWRMMYGGKISRAAAPQRQRRNRSALPVEKMAPVRCTDAMTAG